MAAYIFRRVLLMIPTLWAVITLNFFIIQIAPGGPVEQQIAVMQGIDNSMLDRVSGNNQSDLQGTDTTESKYLGARGLDPSIIKEIEQRFGFDKPIMERYWMMLRSYVTFDFGDSFFKGESVMELVMNRLPVSVSLGLWSTLIIYMISIPLGIYKARNHGSQFDTSTTTLLITLSAIPGFLLAVLLIVLFAGGNYFDWFPLRGLVSDNWDSLSWFGKITDYLWHMFLPTIALTIGGFLGLTLLTKNSFLDEIGKQYVMTARAKGNTERKVMYGHVFRNAMLIIIAGFPAAFIGILFGSSLLIEVIFSLEGLGLLTYEAINQRDYPVIFATLYVFTFIGLVMSLIGDLMYTVVDPRIDFEGR